MGKQYYESPFIGILDPLGDVVRMSDTIDLNETGWPDYDDGGESWRND